MVFALYNSSKKTFCKLISILKRKKTRILETTSLFTYLEANSALTILKIIIVELSTFKYGANIDILVPKPSCIIGKCYGIELVLLLSNSGVLFI